ncbi:hypothetical protein R1flu_000148 [Riccia fluitans]|uniref:MHD domain-containing protein n=1 Tax=Riccia fluitans TaxID=41844 RepID=A0ABD1XZM0_9MARC
MLHCMFLLSDVGEVMLEKQWMGQQVDRSICSWFWTQAHPPGQDDSGPPKVPAVIASPTYYLINIVREGVTFLACTQSEMQPLLAIEFLCRVADVLADYFGGLNEDLIKDNYVLVYELLDEMMDSGFPLTTEPSILREMISPPNLVSRVLSVVTGGSSSMSSTLPLAASSNVPWRALGIKHSNNEVYFDLVEEMDAIVNKDGFLVKCQVYGEVQGNSRLSGMPELTLNFLNPSIISDVKFHPCVRYEDWESRQLLKFVPPDGHFKLMSYRVKGLENTPVYVKPQLSCSEGVVRVNILVGIRVDPGRTIESIVIDIPWPPSVTTAELTANHGSVLYNSSTKVCTWTIGRIPKDKSPCLTGSVNLEAGLDRLHEFPTILVGFKIMGVALSGLKVDKVEFANVGYRPYKGFRAVTKATCYEIRT